MLLAIYPTGLVAPFLMAGTIGGGSNGASAMVAFGASWCFYIVHFILSMVVPDKGFFRIMIIILIIALILNLSGCAMMLDGLKNIH